MIGFMRPNTEDNGGSLLQQVKIYVESLVSAIVTMSDRTKHLPKVDKDGRSECHFAEDMYAEQEESIQKVKEDYANLKRMVAQVNDILNKDQKNLDTLRSSHKALNNDSAKSRFTFAEIQQKYHRERVIATLKQINQVLSWAESALQMAQAKKYPGKKPEKQLHIQKREGMKPPFQGPDKGKQGQDKAELVPSGLTAPIEGLVNLGPMNGKSP